MPPAPPIELPATFLDPGDVRGRRVLITGAGRGLGSVLAMAFSCAGARVALMSRTESDLLKLAAQLPGDSLVCTGDVGTAGDNERVCQHVVDEWGGLDVAILNAGISPSIDDPLAMSAETWGHIININLSGVFFGARAAARVMAPGGRIIATGSVLADRPRAGLAAYSASKAGVIGLIRALALDFAPRGITLNAVSPGWFESPLASGWMANEALNASVVDHTALGRWGRSQDLTGPYVFLASESSRFITGSMLAVDGGYLLV
jgi:NAD(P)-dependent dehydrogenase (short-subunit alcohol dehydrogenase family)